MVEERKYKSVSLSNDLTDEVEAVIEQEKVRIGEALLPADYRSVAAFIAESTRLRLQKIKQKAS